MLVRYRLRIQTGFAHAFTTGASVFTRLIPVALLARFLFKLFGDILIIGLGTFEGLSEYIPNRILDF